MVLFTRSNSPLIYFFLIENETNHTSNTDKNSEIVMQIDVINSC